MIRRLLTATALVAAVAFPSQAQELAPEPAPAGTAEGASALRASLAAYLTEIPFEKGILRIEPDPAGQRIVLDPAPFLKDYFEIDAKAPPIAFLVSPRTDGDWNVFSRDPIRVAFDTKVGDEVQSFEYSQGEQVFKGVYAPSLFAYRSAEGAARDTVSIQNEALTDSKTTIAGTKLSMSAKPGSAGGVDIDFRQTLTDVAQSVDVKTLPPAEGESPEEAESRAAVSSLLMSVGLKASEVETLASVKGARNVEALDLYSLVLRNAGAIETDHKAALAGPFGEELRAALLKILPIWSSFDVAVAAREASFQSAFGTVRVGEARQATRMTGVAEDARLETDISLDGFSVEGALLPPWAARFIPKSAELGVAVAGLDLATPADLAVREADFTADEPFSEEVKAELLESFAPEKITITLKPSVVRATDFDMNLSGELHFVDEKPEGTLTARASGLDRTIESLQRAAEREPELHQVVGMVQMAQGFGRKTDKGDWEWVVEAAADGSVSVNGNMLKGPDPEVDPEALSDDDPDTGADTGAAGEAGQP